MNIDHLHAVPNLTTALNGPLLKLERHLLDNQTETESWFRAEWRKTPAPFYASVDLRNAGFKLAPVDTNLFPAGFNNLNPAFIPLCVHAVQSAIERVCPSAMRLILITENHTRNLFYFESVATLQEILDKAGLDVRVGSLDETMTKALTIDLPSGKSVTVSPVTRDNDKISIDDFTPCAILLNNDLSSGRPALLEGIKQEVVPPLELGWAQRLKSQHFTQYRQVAQEFAKLINIDPWFIDPIFRHCGEINFMKREGESCLQKNVSNLLTDIRAKYEEYHVDKEPFVIIKADAGTYGMGIMTVTSPDELEALNRKQRTKMSASKGGQEVSKVIIQEGVYTFETWGDDQAVTEPVIYMIDHFVVGGFYRVHKGRGVNENLNAPGMHFEPLAFAETCNNPDSNKAPDANPNRFYAYGVIARLALLAAAREIAAQHS